MKEQIAQTKFPELIDIATLADLLGGWLTRYVRGLVAERQIAVVKVGHHV